MLYPVELRAPNLKLIASAGSVYLQKIGRGGRIRTADPLLPKQLRYQAALHPESIWNFRRRRVSGDLLDAEPEGPVAAYAPPTAATDFFGV